MRLMAKALVPQHSKSIFDGEVLDMLSKNGNTDGTSPDAVVCCTENPIISQRVNRQCTRLNVLMLAACLGSDGRSFRLALAVPGTTGCLECVPRIQMSPSVSETAEMKTKCDLGAETTKEEMEDVNVGFEKGKTNDKKQEIHPAFKQWDMLQTAGKAASDKFDGYWPCRIEALKFINRAKHECAYC